MPAKTRKPDVIQPGLLLAEPTITKRPARQRISPADREVKVPAKETRRIESALSLEKWAADEIRRFALVESLNQPVVREALATLRAAYESEIPPYVSGKSGTVVPPAADLNNLLALRSAHRAGFFGALNALENLTREKVLRRVNMNPWGDLQPDESK